MAKKSRADLKEDIKAAKEEGKVARSEKRAFEKSNKLEKDADHSGHEKLGKKWTKLNDMVTKKEKALEALQAAYDEAKPEKSNRVSKYEYPLVDGKEMTALEKKKYRATQRAAAKKAEKGEAAPKKEKKAKSNGETKGEGKKEGKKKKHKEAAEAENNED